MNNFERMIKVAEEVFDAKNDPDQLDVDEEVIAHLQKIHPAAVSEESDENGPIAWILIIPTTLSLMKDFLDKKISEKELYDRTPLNEKYEAIYLCSGIVLPEYRRKGIAKRLTLHAIAEMSKQHTFKAIFEWPFTSEGNSGAESIARELSLPLYKRM
ncbi:MAG: GNAT family N-acetyltransferase [Bacteroidia bacterium]